MDDINYKLGQLEAQVEQLNDTVISMKADVSDIKAQLLTWKSTATGAIAVLSTIGAIILYFVDGIIQYIKVKFGF